MYGPLYLFSSFPPFLSFCWVFSTKTLIPGCSSYKYLIKLHSLKQTQLIYMLRTSSIRTHELIIYIGLYNYIPLVNAVYPFAFLRFFNVSPAMLFISSCLLSIFSIKSSAVVSVSIYIFTGHNSVCFVLLYICFYNYRQPNFTMKHHEEWRIAG